MDDSLYQGKFRVASTRLLGYDYGQNGAYFVTICTKNRQPYFGTIEVQEENWDAAFLRTSALGEKAVECWNAIPEFAPFVSLNAFILMPDHLHGVLLFDKDELGGGREDTQNVASLQDRFGPQSKNLASVLRGFKSAVTMYARHYGIEFYWQPRFYDRVVRNQSELEGIRQYISTNPARWEAEYDNGESLYR